MKQFLSPNIETNGRIVRVILTVVLLLAGLLTLTHMRWLGIILIASAGFVFFEALRGWCLFRACGIKTKL